MAEIDLGHINLNKGDMIMAIGRGKAVYISNEGRVKEIGHKELPPYAYLMYPLVARVIPEEFMGPGDFSQIEAMEEKLGEYFGSAEEIYERVGPALAGQGVNAERLAKVFIELSPVGVAGKTGDISPDTLKLFVRGVADKIIEYYPGSVRSLKERRRPDRKIPTDTGKHKGKDGISF